MAAWESLKTTTFVTLCVSSVSIFYSDSQSASPVANGSALKNSICPVPRSLRKALQLSLCLGTAAAPNLPSSDRDPSVHHIQIPTPTFASLSLAHHSASLCAAVSSLSMTVLTASSLSRLGQHMVSASRSCSCSFLLALHICAPNLVWL